MTTLAVAWRIRRVAVYASIVPMLSMLAFGISGSPLYYVVQFVVHRVVSDNGTYFNPDRVEIAVHGGIALALGAMIGGALVEVLLSQRTLRESWPPLLPRPEVLRFGLAMLPFAIAINLLPIRYLHYDFLIPLRYMIYDFDVVTWSEGAVAPAIPMLFQLAFSVAIQPHLEWSLTALIALPLAGHLLSLPAREGGASVGSAVRAIRLVCTLVATSLAMSLLMSLAHMVLVTEIHLAAMPHWTRPAMLYLTISAQYSIWYFAALTFITIAAVAIAITVRRPAASTRAVQ